MYLNTFCNRKAAVRLLLCIETTKTAGNSGQTTNRFNTQLLRVMRLTAIILLAGCLQVAAKVNSQTITFSAKNADLQSVFKVIEKQTGFIVAVNEAYVRQGLPVNIDAVNMPLEEFLSMVFKDQPLSYSIEAQTIFLSKKLTLPTITEKLETEQPPVTGVVKDSTGMPLVGATVTVKSSKKSVQTNAKGEFTIEAQESDILTITFVGFEKQTVRLTGGNSVFVVLNAANSPLDEVQIQAYGKTSRRLNTGTITTIKGEDITKQPVTNPLLALQGRVPNLVVMPGNGLPNGPVTLQLRGQNSLARSNGVGPVVPTEPLIVIDGIPFQNNISAGTFGSFGSVGERISALTLINPIDIDQIDVLTDADATSIYGSRGGNGVILVTTKKGRVGKTQFNLGVSSGFNEVPRQLQLLSTADYVAMRKEAYLNDGLSIPDKSSPVKDYSNYDLSVWDTSRYTNWQKEFLGGTAPTIGGTLSISGGSPLIQYQIGAAFNSSKYIYPGENKYQSGNVSLNLTTSSSNGKFRSLLSAGYGSNRSTSSSGDFTRLAVRLAPNAPALYTQEGGLNWEPDTTSFGNPSTWENPLAQLNRITDLTLNNIRGSVSLSYEIAKNLTMKLVTGYSEIRNNTNSSIPISSFDPSNLGATGSATHTNITIKSNNVEPQLNFSTIVGPGRLDAYASVSYQSQSQLSQTVVGEGYTSDALLKTIEGAPIVYGANTSSQYKYVAGSGRIAYNVDNKYLLNLTARRDGSSRFGPGYQYGNFWSVGAGWIFSEENIFKRSLSAISYGKARFSYGTSGNDGIGDYQYLELYDPIRGINYQNMTLLQSRGAYNVNYHWESIRKLEASLELGFFKDRVLLTGSYWRTRSADQIGVFPLPATGGARLLHGVVKNQSGKIQNSGIDLLLNGKILAARSFSWTMAANIGFLWNKLLAKPEGLYNTYGLNRFVTEGEPFSGFEIMYESKGVNPITGLYQFVDRNGNVSSAYDNPNYDQKKINTKPVTLGISNNIRYKSITLDFFLQLTKQIGRNYLFDPAFTSSDDLNYGYFFSLPGGEYGNLPQDLLNHWRNQGDISSIQRFSTKRFDEVMRPLFEKARGSDLAWSDASFIRLRNISLSYAFPKALLKRLHMNDLRVYMQGQNIITFSHYGGRDPEIQNELVLPQLRTIIFGIQINL